MPSSSWPSPSICSSTGSSSIRGPIRLSVLAAADRAVAVGQTANENAISRLPWLQGPAGRTKPGGSGRARPAQVHRLP